MKKPDEIKKGLRFCGGIAQIIKGCIGGQVLLLATVIIAHIVRATAAALTYIKQLEEENTRRHEKIMQLYSEHESLTGIIKTIAEDSKATFQQLESQVPKWISVQERLPENTDDVLMMTNFGIGLGFYDIYNDNWIDYTCTDIISVTHWMPLPEVPKEDPECRK